MTETKTFARGDKVSFTTAGRYRTTQVGTYKGMDDNNRFSIVDVDGTEKKTRPSTLRAA